MSRIYEASLRLQEKAALVLTIGLAFAGQRLFSSRPENQFPVMAVVLICGAIAALVFLLARTRVGDEEGPPEPVPERTYSQLRATPWRIWCGLIAVGGSLLATILSQQPSMSWWALGLWIVATACALLVVQEEWPQRSLRMWLRTHWAEAALVSACVLVAFLARATSLATIPSIISGDEGSFGLNTRDLMSGRNTRLFEPSWDGMPQLSMLLVAGPMTLWGQDILGVRMHSALTGTATVLALYWLLRSEGSVLLAQCAIWILATFPLHIHFSRIGMYNVDAGFLITGAFAAFFWGIYSRQRLGWALAGLAATLGLYVYPGARIILILAIVFVTIVTLSTRGRWFLEHWPGLAVAAAIVLIAGLPMFWYAFNYWDDYNSRMNQVGILQSGWLAAETERSGQSEPAIIARQFVRSLFAYGFYRDHADNYDDNTASLLLFLPAMLFPLGLGISLFYARRRLFLLLPLWFFMAVGLAGTLTVNPPNYARLSGLAPAFSAMVALAVVTLARLGKRLALWSHRSVLVGTVLVIATVGLAGLRHYFVTYSPLDRFGGRNAEVATEVGKLLRTVEPDTKAYFLGQPRMYYNFSTLTFLAPAIEGFDLPNPLTEIPSEYESDRPSFFFSIPEREPELRQIAELVPGGQWTDGKRAVDGSPLFSAYYLAQASASNPAPAAPAASAYPAPAIARTFPGAAITRADPATSTHPATLVVILLPVTALLLFTGYGLWERGTRLWWQRQDVVVGAVFQDGVIKPHAPLHLPENTPLQVWIRLPAAQPGALQEPTTQRLE